MHSLPVMRLMPEGINPPEDDVARTRLVIRSPEVKVAIKMHVSVTMLCNRLYL